MVVIVDMAGLVVVLLGCHALSCLSREVGQAKTALHVQYDRRMMYHGVNVTGLVTSGTNALGLLLGNGFYVKEKFNTHPVVKLLLVVTAQDGSVQFVTTNTGKDTKAGV